MRYFGGSAQCQDLILNFPQLRKTVQRQQRREEKRQKDERQKKKKYEKMKKITTSLESINLLNFMI